MISVDVIGGSGFIGTRLVTRLLANERATVKISDKVSSSMFPELCRLADIRSPEELERSLSEASLIVHLAAEHRDDVSPVSLYEEVNVQGAQNVCVVARRKGIQKIIFTSSVAVYGFPSGPVDESGIILPCNEYGRTKYLAEEIFKTWQLEAPNERVLVIIRPTVVFGESNRGNVYNLLRQIALGRFLMVGSGRNRKSMAYVENLAAFIEYSFTFGSGIHVYNYVDKPDYSMNELFVEVSRRLRHSSRSPLKVPFILGFLIGQCFDLLAALTGKRFAISAIRVKKFCSESVYRTSFGQTGFEPPVSMEKALDHTIQHEFLDTKIVNLGFASSKAKPRD